MPLQFPHREPYERIEDERRIHQPHALYDGVKSADKAVNRGGHTDKRSIDDYPGDESQPANVAQALSHQAISRRSDQSLCAPARIVQIPQGVTQEEIKEQRLLNRREMHLGQDWERS